MIRKSKLCKNYTQKSLLLIIFYTLHPTAIHLSTQVTIIRCFGLILFGSLCKNNACVCVCALTDKHTHTFIYSPFFLTQKVITPHTIT